MKYKGVLLTMLTDTRQALLDIQRRILQAQEYL